MNNILLTGGLGYIGSHTAISLCNAGYKPVILDDLSNSKIEVIDNLREITNIKIPLYIESVHNSTEIAKIIQKEEITGVIHFSAKKSVAESVANPLLYYRENINGLLSLLMTMEATEVHNLVFSSSATVYKSTSKSPITEDSDLEPKNPYGYTKLFCEQILSDTFKASSKKWKIGILRYFNPAGAHPSGLIGESPTGTPNNLMPFITQVAKGIRPHLNIWGNDYNTRDGTGIRDFIHVIDLAEGHVKAYQHLMTHDSFFKVNLGTGCGTSVKELIEIFQKVNGVNVPYQYMARREGDVAECWADATLANSKLAWKASKSIEEICVDAWRWENRYST